MQARRSRARFTQTEVVTAALAVLDEHGLGAVTIRSVGARLGAAPMSLYSYFNSKHQLLDLMFAEVASRLYADAGHPTWQAELTALCLRVRSMVLLHPNWRLLFSRAEAPRRIPVTERLLGLMKADGIPPPAGFIAAHNACVMALGFALVELTFRGPGGQSSFVARFERVKEQCRDPEYAAEQPITVEACKDAPPMSLDRNFETAVSAFVAGVEASRVSEPRSDRATAE
jgi:AcrR family transcriptional regulator